MREGKLDPINPLLPRQWNKKLLPGWTVIAVDQRDPRDLGHSAVNNPDELPCYPQAESLLHDPDHIRFRRRTIEMAVYGLYRGDRQKVDWYMGQGISQAIDDYIPVDGDEDFQKREFNAVVADYRANTRAVIDTLS